MPAFMIRQHTTPTTLLILCFLDTISVQRLCALVVFDLTVSGVGYQSLTAVVVYMTVAGVLVQIIIPKLPGVGVLLKCSLLAKMHTGLP